MKTIRCLSSLAAVSVISAAVLGSVATGVAASRSNARASSTARMNKKLHAMLPRSIKSSGVITMATDGTIGAPFASFAPDNKTLVGLDVDLGRAIAQVLGVRLNVVNTAFDSFIPGLAANRYDFSASVMLDTHKREKVVDFVDFIKDGSGFLVKAGSPMKSLTLAKLCGLKAGTLSGSVEDLDLSAQSTKCKKAHKKAIDIHVFQQNNQAILAVVSGRIDVYDGDSDQNAWIQKQKNGQVQQSGPAYGVAIDGMPVHKHSALLKPLQAALQELMNNGTYKRILGKYGVAGGGLRRATIDHAVL